MVTEPSLEKKLCHNKIFENHPELKIANIGVVGEEVFDYACSLCNGYNSCSAYIEYVAV